MQEIPPTPLEFVLRVFTGVVVMGISYFLVDRFIFKKKKND